MTHSPVRPTKARLAAHIGEIANSWDLWIFPRRQRRDGSDLTVAPSLTGALSCLYSGFAPAGTPAAAKAAVVIAEAGSPEVEEALAQGRAVVAIGKAEGVPNVSLGWWFMGDQVGAALLEHPIFGDLPLTATCAAPVDSLELGAWETCRQTPYSPPPRRAGRVKRQGVVAKA